jgi:hypothetical protein
MRRLPSGPLTIVVASAARGAIKNHCDELIAVVTPHKVARF